MEDEKTQEELQAALAAAKAALWPAWKADARAAYAAAARAAAAFGKKQEIEFLRLLEEAN